jgi:hypothetical protein
VAPHREAKLARASVKAATPAAAMPPPAVLAAAARLPSPPHVTEMAVSGTGRAAQELSVDDYLVGTVTCLMPRLGCRVLVSCLDFS